MIDDFLKPLILFFIKYPEVGQVKTRLAAVIGDDKAAELYGNFVQDLLSGLKSLKISFHVCFLPEEKRGAVMSWLGGEFRYRPQKGGDLGERMKDAFIAAFSEGLGRVILIGSDFPDLPLSYLVEALGELHTHDAVLGPAVDGGYYLIGFRSDAFLPEIFDNMVWGTDSVYRQTLSKLTAHKKTVYILTPWNDVDTFQDLEKLIDRSRYSPFSNSKTMAFLSHMGVGP
ncbi:MAG: TIGR04282 family arsenosugar biosynthesis glycosyltransferase [Pseudomonadota bacterium]